MSRETPGAQSSSSSRIQEITALLSRLADDEQQLAQGATPSLKSLGALRRHGGAKSAPESWASADDIENAWKEEVVRQEGNVVSRRLWGREEGAMQLAMQQELEREEAERQKREREEEAGVLLTERTTASMATDLLSDMGSKWSGADVSVILETELEKLVPGWPVSWERRPCVLRRVGVRGGACIDYYKSELERLAARIRGHMDLYPATQVIVSPPPPEQQGGPQFQFTVAQNGGKRFKWVLRAASAELGLVWVAAIRGQVERLQLQVLCVGVWVCVGG